MAFTNFYLVAGGSGASDINAGFSTGAAQVTTTNGNWNATTGVFIAASGTPFASTIVGDYASVYIDAATVTTFVGKVTTVTSSTQITVDIATIKYGTAPSTSATARSCTINGAWNSEIVLAATGLGTTTVPQATKINITGNPTVAASRTVSMAGTTTLPLWFSGYATTPDDLDADTTNALTKPTWTFSSTFALTTSGSHQLWTGLTMSGTRSGFIWTMSGAQSRVQRCRIINASTNAAAYAMNYNVNGGEIAYCYGSVPTTGTTTGIFNIANDTDVIGTIASGSGTAGFEIGTALNVNLIGCVSLDSAGVGINTNASRVQVIGCTFSNCTSDAIKWVGTPSVGSMVVGALIRIAGGYGINNSSGTNTNNVYRACNGMYSVTSGRENGFGDSPESFPQTLSTDPSVSNSVLSLVGGTLARRNGFPGIFENQSYSSYLDEGAAQHQEANSTGFAS